jgi:hypothetical protein
LSDRDGSLTWHLLLDPLACAVDQARSGPAADPKLVRDRLIRPTPLTKRQRLTLPGARPGLEIFAWLCDDIADRAIADAVSSGKFTRGPGSALRI